MSKHKTRARIIAAKPVGVTMRPLVAMRPISRNALLTTASVGAAALAMWLVPNTAYAQITDGRAVTGTGTVVVPGSATITQSEGFDNVLVNSGQAIIDWDLADDATGGGDIVYLPTGETLRFNGPGNYTVLNRIVPTDATRGIRIDGIVQSLIGGENTGGNVWFYSPGGIVAGATSTFNVGGLLLTTNAIDVSNGLFISPGTVRFAGAADSRSDIVVEAGAQINALVNGSSYVAMVAPRVQQSSIVRVNGSVAYVAAEQADLTIREGLFDISVRVGSTDPNGIVHTGITTGPARTPLPDVGYGAVPDNQQIYMVAVPKNDAITMLVSGGIGYTPAANATQANGSIILSAGANVVNGVVQVSDDPNTNGNIQFGNTLLTNDILAYAENNINAAVGDNGFFNAQQNVDFVARNDINFGVVGYGTINVGGDLSLEAGTETQGGAIRILNTGTGGPAGSITISGDLTADASAVAPFGIVPGNPTLFEKGSVGTDATGGTVNLVVAGGNRMTVNGITRLNADAAAGIGELSAGTADAGNIAVGIAGDGSQLTFTGSLIVSASAFDTTGRPVPGVPITGASATSGNINFNLAGGLFQAGIVNASSRAFAYAGQDGTPFDATSGNINLNVTGGAHTIADFTASQLALAAGGTATGGTSGITVDSASLNVGSSFTVDNRTVGNTGIVPVESIRVDVQNGATLDVGGVMSLSTDATGGDGSVTNVAGNVTVQVDNALLSANNLFMQSVASGFVSEGSGILGRQSGTLSLFADNAGQILVDAFSQFFAATDRSNEPTGDSGTGGNIIVRSNSSNISFGGTLSVNVDGFGSGVAGPGGSTGTGTGGNATFEVDGADANMSFGALVVSANGSSPFAGEGISNTSNGGLGIGGNVNFNLNSGGFSAGSVTAEAFGIGGDGGDAAGLFDLDTGALVGTIAAGDGGIGVGGNINFNQSGASTVIGSLQLDASGIAGVGGGGDGSIGEAAGDGGFGAGGGVIFNNESGTYIGTSIALTANGNEEFSFEGGGFGQGIEGGRGSDAVGGLAQFNNEGDAQLAVVGITIAANAFGGEGGGSDSANAGQGGTALGGTARYTDNSGTINFDALLVDADARGGPGGSAFDSTTPQTVTGGDGNTGTGGTAQIILNQDIALNPSAPSGQYQVTAIGTGGNGNDGTNGGNAGFGIGGTAQLLVNADVSINGAIVNASGLGGRGSSGFADNGILGTSGDSGDGIGGSAQVIVSGPAAAFTFDSISLISDGIGGDGDLGFDSFEQDASGNGLAGADGGDAGNGFGGRSLILAQDDAIINITNPGRPVNISSSGRGGIGGSGGAGANGAPGADGIGGNDPIAANGQAGFVGGAGGEGGDAGQGQGGRVEILAIGGTVRGGDIVLNASGTSGIAGFGGGGGQGGPGGQGQFFAFDPPEGGDTIFGYGTTGATGPSGNVGSFGNGALGIGGTVNLTTDVFVPAGPAVAAPGDGGGISFGATQILAQGIDGNSEAVNGLGGRIELNDLSNNAQGGIQLATLDAQANDFPADGNAGFYATSTDGGITILGSANINVGGDVEFDMSDSGQFTVGDELNIRSQFGSVTVRHLGRSDPLLRSISANNITVFAANFFTSESGTFVAADGLHSITTGIGIEAADLFAVTGLDLTSGGYVTLGNAQVTGPVTNFSGSGEGGQLTISAGATSGSGFFGTYAPTNFLTGLANDATITGTVTTTGNINIFSGGATRFNSGATVQTDNRIGVETGDDIVIESGATLTSGLDIVGDFGYGNNGLGDISLSAGTIAMGEGVSPLSTSSILIEGSLTALNGDVFLTADAIQSLGGSITSRSLFADVFNAPINGVPQDDDGGQLVAGCLEGDICLANVGVSDQLQIGQNGGVPINFTLADGQILANDILVTARNGLNFGTLGQTTQYDGVNSVVLTSQEGSVNFLGEAGVSSNAIAIRAANDLLGTGGFFSANDIEISVSSDVEADFISTNGRLVQQGGGTSYTIADSFDVNSLRLGVGNANILAGGNILIDDLTVTNSAAVLNADGAVFLGTTTGTSLIDIDAAAIGFGNIGATGTINLDARTGQISGVQADAGSTVVANAATFIDFSNVSGSNVSLTATSGGITGGNILVNIDTSGANGIALSAGGDVAINNAAAIDGISIAGAGLTANQLQAGGAIGANMTGAVEITNAQAGASLTIAGDSIDLATGSAGTDMALTVASTGPVLGLADPGDIISAVALTAGGSLSIDAGGNIDITVADAGGVLSMTAGQSIGFTNATGSSVLMDAGTSITGGDVAADVDTSGANNVSLIAGGAITIGTAAAIDNIGFSGTDFTATTLDAGGAIVGNQTGAVTIGLADAGLGIGITGGSIDLATGISGGALNLTGSTGGITSGTSLTSAGAMTLDAAGDVSVQIADATGVLTIGADGSIGFDSATGSSTLLTAGGTVSGTLVAADVDTSGANSVVIDAVGAVTVGTITAVNDITLDGASLTSALLDAGSGIDVDVVGAANVTLADAVGVLAISGSTVTLPTGIGGGGIALTSTVGDIVSSTSLTSGGAIALSSANDVGVNTIGAGGVVTMGADGAITFADITGSFASLTAGTDINGGNINIDVDTSGENSVQLTATGAIAVGNVNAIDNIILSGDRLTASLLDAGAGIGATIAGAAVITTADAGGALGIQAGTINLASGNSGGATVLNATAGTLTSDSLLSVGDMTLTATGAIDLERADASGILTANATGVLGFTAATGSNVLLTGATITGGNVAADVDTSGANSISLTSAGAIDINNATAIDNISISGASLVANRLVATNGAIGSTTSGIFDANFASAAGALTVGASAIDLTDAQTGSMALTALAGDITGNGFATGGALALDASENVTIGTADASGNLLIDAGQAISFTNATGANASLIAVGDITGTLIAADVPTSGANSVVIDAGGAVLVGTVTAIDNITVDGSTITSSLIDAGGAIDVDVTNLADIISADSGLGLAISAGTIDLATGNAGGAMALIATAGDIVSSTSLTSSGAMNLSAAGNVDVQIADAAGALTIAGQNINFASATGSFATLTAVGDIVGTNLAADLDPSGENSVVAGAGGAVTVNTIAAIDNITINAASLTSGLVDAGGALGATLTGAANITRAEAGSSLGISATTITLPDASAGSALSLTSTVGDIVSGGLLASGGTVLLDSAANVDVATIDANNVVTIGADTAIAFDAITASSALLTAGTTISGGTILIDVNPSGADNVSLTAVGAIGVDTVTATDNITIRGASIAANGLSAGGAIDSQVTGLAAIAAANAGTGLLIQGTSVDVITAQSGGALTLSATAGNLTGTNFASVGAMNLSATGDAIFTGADASGVLTIGAGGDIGFDSATGSSVGLTGGGDITGNLVAADLDTSGSNDVVVTATGNIAVGTLAAINNITADAVNITAGAANAGSALSLTADNLADVDTLSAGTNLGVSAGRILFVSSASGGATNFASTGNINGGSLTSGGAMTLDAAGLINIQNADANGFLTIGADQSVRFTSATGSGVAVTAGTTINGAIVNADVDTSGANNVALSAGGAIFVNNVTAIDNIGVNGASLASNRLTATNGSIGVTTTGLTDVNQALAGSNLTIDAASIDLGGSQSGGATSLTATAGNLDGGSFASGGAMTLAATGGIAITGADASGVLTITSGGNTGFDSAAGSGALLTIGGNLTGNLLAADVDTSGANSVTANVTGDVNVGAITAIDDVRVDAANIVANVIDGGGAVLLSADTLLDVDTLDAGTNMTVGAGRIVFGSANSGGATEFTSNGNINGGSLTSGGAMTLDAAGLLNIQGADANGLLTITADGSVRVTSATGSGVSVSAGTTINGGTFAADVDTSGANNVSLTAAGAVTAGTVSAIDAITINSASLTANRLTATNSNIDVTASGLADVNNATAGGNIGVSAASIDLTNAAAGGALSLTATTGGIIGSNYASGGAMTLVAAGDAALGVADANGDLFISADAVSFTNATGSSVSISADTTIAGGNVAADVDTSGANNVLVDAQGDISIGNASSIDNLTIAGAAVSTGALSAAQLIDVSGTSIAFTDITGGSVALASGNGESLGPITGTSLTSGSAVNLAASTLNLGSISSTGAVTGTGGGFIIGTLTGSSADFTVTSLDITSGTTTGNFTIAADDTQFTSLDVSGSLSITGGTIAGGSAVADGDIALTGSSIAFDSLAAVGGVSVSGDAITGGDVAASGFTQLTTNVGDLLVGNVSGSDVDLTSAGLSTSGNVTATNGSISISANGPLTAGDLNAANGSISLFNTAGALTAGLVLARDDFTVNTSSDLNFAGVTVNDDIRLTTTGNAVLGVLVINGGPVDTELDGNNIVLSANNLTVDSATAAGGISASGGSISFINLAAGSGIDLVAGTLAGGDASAGGSFSASSSSLATLGNISGGNGVDVIAAGDLSVGSATSSSGNVELISLSGGITFGNADAGFDLLVTAGSGNIVQTGTARAVRDAQLVARNVTVADVNAGDDVLLQATDGDVAVGLAVTRGTDFDESGYGYGSGSGMFIGSNVNLIATGSVTGVTADAFDNVNVNSASLDMASLIAGNNVSATTAGAASADTIAAGGDVTVDAGGVLAFDTLGAGGAALVSADRINGGAVNTGGLVDMSAIGAVVFTDLAAGSSATISGASVRGDSAAAGDGDLVITSTVSNLNIGAVSSLDEVNLVSAGNVVIGTGIAGYDFTVDAVGNVALGDIETTGIGGTVPLPSANIDVDAGGFVTVTHAESADNIFIDGASFATGISSLIADDNIVINVDGDANLGNSTATGLIDVTAGGAVTGVLADAGTGLTIEGASIAVTTATSGSDMALTATSGAITGTTYTSGGATTITAPVVTIASLTSAGDIAGTGGDFAFTTLNGDANASFTVDSLTVGSGTIAGNLTSTAGATGFTTLDVGGILAISGGSVAGGNATANSIAITDATSVGFDSLGGVAGIAIGAESVTGGNLAASAGGVSVDASGALALADVTASGVVDLAGSTLSFTDIVGGSVVLTSGTGETAGPITGDSITSGSAIDLAASTLNLGTISSTGAVTGTGGDFTIDTLTGSSADFTVNSLAITSGTTTGDFNITADVTGFTSLDAGGNLAITGGTVTGGGAVADGDIGISGSAIAFDLLTADGVIDVTGESISGGDVAALGAVQLTTNVGDLVVGTVSGSGVTLDSAGASTSGNVTATNGSISILAAGALTAGDLTAANGSITLANTAGNLTAGTVLARDDFTVNTASDLNFAAITVDDDIRITTTGNAIFGTVRTNGGADNDSDGSNINLAANSLTVANAASAGSISLDATAIGFDTLTAFNTIALTGGSVSGGDASTSGLFVASVTGAASLGDVVGTGLVQIDAGSIAIDSATSVGDILLTAQTGDVNFGNAATERDLLVTALAGNVTQTGIANAARDVIISGNNLDIASVLAGDDIELSAVNGNLTLNSAVTDGSFDETGYGYGSGSTDSNINLSASGGIFIADAGARAFDNLTSTSTTLDANLLSAGDNISLITTGIMQADSLDAGNNISVDAGGEFGFTSLIAGNDATMFADSIGAGTNAINVGRNLLVTTDGNARLGDTLAGGSVSVTSNSAIVFTNIDAGTSVLLSGAQSVVGNLVDAGTTLTVSGATVDIGTAISGGDMALTAVSGSLTGTSFTSGGNTSLSAQTANIGSVDSVGNVSASGGDFTIDTLTGDAGADFTVTRLQLNDATLANSLTIAADATIFTNFDIGGDLAIGNGDITGGDATVAGTTTINASNLAFGTLDSVGNISLTAGRIVGTSLITDGSIAATSEQGIDLGTVVAAGGVNLSNSLANAINVGSVTATGGNVIIANTSATAGFGDLRSVVAGDITAGGDINIAADGGFGFAALTGGDAITANAASISGGSIVGTGPVTLRANTISFADITGGTVDLAAGSGEATGSISGTSVTSNGTTIISGSSVDLASVTSTGTLTGTGGDFAIGSLAGRNANFTVNSLDVDTGTLTGALTIDAGSTVFGNLTVTGDLAISGGSVDGGTARARSIAITNATDVGFDSLTTAQNLSIAAESVAGGSLTSINGAIAVDTTGDLAISTASARNAVDFSAAAIAFTDITGGSVSLAADNGETLGVIVGTNITSRGTTNLVGGNRAGANVVLLGTLNSAGDITASGGDFAISALSGDGNALFDVASLGITNGAVAGDFTIASGATGFATLTAGGAFAMSGGNVTGGVLTADTIAISDAGAVSLDDATADTISIVANSTDIDLATAGTTLAVTAATQLFGTLSAGTSTNLAGNTIIGSSVTGGQLDVSATGAVDIRVIDTAALTLGADIFTFNTLTTAGDASITTTGETQGNSFAIGGDAEFASGNHTTGFGTIGGDLVIVTGELIFSELDAAGSVDITGERIVSGNLTSGGTTTLAADSLELNSVSSAGALTATGGEYDIVTLAGESGATFDVDSAFIRNATIADNLSVTADATRFLSLTVGDTLAIDSGTILGGTATAGAVLLTSSGTTTTGALTGTLGDIVITSGGAIATGDLSAANGSVSLTNTAGGLAAGLITALNDFTVNTVADISFDGVSVDDDIRISTTGTANLGTLVADGGGTDTEGDGSNIVLAANGLTVASADAAGDVRMSAQTGDIAFGTATAGGDIIVDALAGNVTHTGTANAGRDALISGNMLDLGNVLAGDDIVLVARSGDIALGSAVTDGSFDESGYGYGSGSATDSNVDISATGGLIIAGAGASAFDNLTIDSGSVSATALAAGDDIAVTTTDAAQFATADAGGAVAITSGALDFTAITAGSNVVVNANGGANGETIDAGQTVSVSGDLGVMLNTITAGEDANLAAVNGAVVVLNDLVLGGDVSASGESVSLNAQGNLSVDAAQASVGDVSISAGGLLDAEDIEAAGNVGLTSAGSSVITGDIGAEGGITITAADSIEVIDDVVAGARLVMTANNGITIDALASGAEISLTSSGIDIGAEGQVGDFDVTQSITFTNSGPGPMVVGGDGVDDDWSLDNDEFSRVFSGGDITFVAPLNAQGERLATPPVTLIIDDLTVETGLGNSGSQAGNIGANGALSFIADGSVEVIGAVDLTNATSENTIGITAGRNIVIDAANAGINIAGAQDATSGRIELEAVGVYAVTPEALEEIIDATTDLVDERLAENDGIVRDAPILGAESMLVTVDEAFFVQNTAEGTRFSERRGYAVGSGGLTISTLGSETAIVINGTAVGANGQIVTGVDVVPLTTIESRATGNGGFAFDDLSTINGCLLADPAGCFVAPEVPVLIDRDIIEEIVDEEQDEVVDENPEGGFSANLIELKEFEKFGNPPLIDEPVTGAGNDDLWVPPSE